MAIALTTSKSLPTSAALLARWAIESLLTQNVRFKEEGRKLGCTDICHGFDGGFAEAVSGYMKSETVECVVASEGLAESPLWTLLERLFSCASIKQLAAYMWRP